MVESDAKIERTYLSRDNYSVIFNLSFFFAFENNFQLHIVFPEVVQHRVDSDRNLPHVVARCLYIKLVSCISAKF